MKLKDLLLETAHLSKIEVLIKTSGGVNKVEVYNDIRALKGVVVCTVEQNGYLETKSTDNFEYSLLHIKFISGASAQDTMKEIRKDALVTNKIDGLLQFIPRFQTLEKIGKY